ncbi:hypothetical protein RclHR1_10130002 [Rhizophagus clarus]|uniref:Uncharacterized protein n=1 Tax=Rhizophagus clarus TaxID=94130 RepID=A0A2Z6Q109_9GLOM|nr:hypothetical protein RclHR1_10130002 [Rhizophagus clarus]
MPSNRTPFYSKLVIFVIFSCILCQIVVSIPVSVNPPRITLQSDHDEVTIKISTDNQIYEKVSSDAYQPDEFSTYNTYKVYDATAEFPAENTISIYNPISDIFNSIANFFSNIYNAIVKFFSDNHNTIINFISDAYNAIAEFVKNHVALTIGAIVIFVLLISGVIPSLITFLINLIGFGVTGIAKGSYAALFMANYAGNVAVGSACAILQSAGALGVKGIGGLIKLLFKLFHLLIIYISHIITCWII